MDGDTRLGRARRGVADRLGGQVRDGDLGKFKRQPARLKPVQYQQVIDQPEQPVGVPLEDLEEVEAVFRQPVRLTAQQLDERDDGSQRCPQLVREDREELRAALVQARLSRVGLRPVALRPAQLRPGPRHSAHNSLHSLHY